MEENEEREGEGGRKREVEHKWWRLNQCDKHVIRGGRQKESTLTIFMHLNFVIRSTHKNI